MNCRRADQLFSAAWEDELSLAERETLESHIEACASCRRSYDEFARVMEAVQTIPKAEASADFAEGVWSRIRAAERPAAARRKVFAGGWWTASFRPALAAAACLVVVGAAVVWWNQRPSENPLMTERAKAAPSIASDTQSPPSPVAVVPAPSEPKLDIAASPSRREVAKSEPSSIPTSEPADEKSLAARDEAGDLAKKQEGAAAPMADFDASALGALQTRGGRADGLALSAQDTAALYDSLFNHDYDVEFALDPVHLKKLPGQGKLSPARPMPADVQGKRASVTF